MNRPGVHDEEVLEKAVMRKATMRLMPLLMVMYLISYIDRSNINFAGLTMNKDLGLSNTTFSLGAAFFFVGYFFFQVPGNMALDRFGARRLISAMIFLWGLLASCMAFVWNDHSFYLARLAVGAAESAFFPGVMFYIGLWFPRAYRGRVIAMFMLAGPLSNVVGLPISGLLSQLDGVWGLTSWQWIFVGEGIPAVLMAFVAFHYLTDRPADADWLAPDERAWLMQAMEADKAMRPVTQKSDGWRAIVKPRSLLLGFAYFGMMMGLYGFSLFLPQLVRRFGLSLVETGFVSALPYSVAVLFMIYWGRRIDRRGDVGWHAAATCVIGVVGLVGSALIDSPVLALLSLSLAATGLHSATPTLWTIVVSQFSGTAAAASIGFVSCMGPLGSFVGQYMMGYLRDLTGGFTIGLIVLAVPMFGAGWVALKFRGQAPSVDKTPPGPLSKSKMQERVAVR